MCEHCEEVQNRYEIRSPNELKKAIRVVRAKVIPPKNGGITLLLFSLNSAVFADINRTERSPA